MQYCISWILAKNKSSQGGEMDFKVKISSIDEKELSHAYGILCASVFTDIETSRNSTELTFCRILPGLESTLHSHYENEFFYVIKGEGMMTIDHAKTQVKAGDIIEIHAFCKHSLKNSNPIESLEFLSIYSQTPKVSGIPSELLVTSAPPTPNGPLHLGHLSGPYLGADVINRYMKMRRVNSVHRSGTDDFQNYVFEKGGPEGFRQKIIEGLGKSNIVMDEFISPFQNEAYQKFVQSFFVTLRNDGLIEKKRLALPFCRECDLTLVDVYLSGKCAHCFESSSGACESCGVVTPPYEILEPHCGKCHKEATSKEVEVYVFDLKPHLFLLEDLHQKLSKQGLKTQTLISHFKATKLSPLVISHPGKWGIKVPGEEDLVIHVWFEMAAAYTMLRNKSESNWVHSFGVDNSYYYLLLVPILMKVFNSDEKSYSSVVINEFLNLEGRKFSTGRGHAIWVNEFMDEVASDAVRLYLAKVRPELHASNFELTSFNQFYGDVYNRLEALLKESTLSGEVLVNLGERKFIERLNFITRDLEVAYHPESFSLNNAYRLIEETLSLVESVKTHSALFTLGKRVLAKMSYPITPELSSGFLGRTDPDWEQDVNLYV